MTDQPERSATTRSQERPADRADLPDGGDRRRDRFHEYEQMLVDRIGDVDDDLRATALRFQRAWQTQREETDRRLRRHAWFLGGLTLFAILFAGALFLVYRQIVSGPQRVAAEISEMRRELADFSGERAVYAQVWKRLDRVDAQVAEITSRLEKSNKDEERSTQAFLATERTAGDRAEDRVSTIADMSGTQDTGNAPGRDLGGPPMVETIGTSGAKTLSGGVPVARAADADASVADMSGARDVGNAPGQDVGGPPIVETVGAGSTETASGGVPVDGAADASASGLEVSHMVAKGGYALQLIGYFDRESLDEFMARKKLPARIYVIHETYRNRPWHAIIHSLHAGFTAAEEALFRLPANLAVLDPWIRSLPEEGTELQIIETGSGRPTAAGP